MLPINRLAQCGRFKLDLLVCSVGSMNIIGEPSVIAGEWASGLRRDESVIPDLNSIQSRRDGTQRC